MLLDSCEITNGNELNFVGKGKLKGAGHYTLLANVIEISKTNIKIKFHRDYKNLIASNIYILRNFLFKVIRERYLSKVLQGHENVCELDDIKSKYSGDSVFLDELQEDGYFDSCSSSSDISCSEIEEPAGRA
jgi:hypothetical protein